jgi:hypothetical protein
MSFYKRLNLLKGTSMKYYILILTFFLSNAVFASTAWKSLQCGEVAVIAAIKELEMTRAEFDNEMSLLWACKSKANPKSEEIQFGDNSGLVSVSLVIENGKCIVKGVYTGQNDQDEDEESTAANCLP